MTSSANISAQELAVTLSAGACQLIDVREPVEYAESHLPQAKLVSLGTLEARAGEMDKSAPVVVMCHAGKRGATAAEKLKALGFTNVRNLEGGILAWKAAGMPCAAAESGKPVMPLMRQVQIVIGICVFAGSLLAVTVNPAWVYLCMFFGAGLLFAGLSGWCGLAILLSKMPWNRVSTPSCQTKGSCCD
jgi:rhodanese-related sulfurtransferase